MKSKAKPVKLTRKPVPKKLVRGKRSVTRRAEPKKIFSQTQIAILTRVWPRISKTTTFVKVPATQGLVAYGLPSGEGITATLMWYSFSHGPRVRGHYDDAGDVCYVGEVIE